MEASTAASPARRSAPPGSPRLWGIITAGTLTISSTGDVDLTKANQVQSTGTISTGTNFFHFANAGGFNVGGSIIAGNVELTAGGTGSITQTSSTVAAATLTATAGGDISFNRANAVGLYNIRAGDGRTITLRNAGNLQVKAITAQDGTVNLASNIGSVDQQAGSGNSISTGRLNVDAATDIVLAGDNFVDTLGNLSAGGSITYDGHGFTTLGGNVHAGGALTMNVTGTIHQSAGTITADHLDLTAFGIELASANDIGSTTASNFTATNNVTAFPILFRSANAILLGTISAQGSVSLIADSGGITQTGTISAAMLDAKAIGGDIVLDQNNAIGTLNGISAGGSFTLKTNGDLALNGEIAAPNLVKITAGGAITQDVDHSAITTASLQAGGATGISLLGANDVAAADLNGNGNDLRFRNLGNISIGSVNAAGHMIELVSDTGTITQSDPVNGALIGSLIVNAAGGATLLGRDNQIEHLDVISGGDVSIASGSNGYGGVMTVDRIAAAGRRVSLTNSVAAINGGNIAADYLYLFGLGVDLTAAASNVGTLNAHTPGGNLAFTNTGNLLIDGIVTNGATDVTLRSEQGGITQANNAIVTIRGLTAYGRDGVNLAGTIDRIAGLSAGTGADVSVSSDHALEITGDIAARNVTLLANNGFGPNYGAITQTGGSITADNLTASAYGVIDLQRANHVGTVKGLTSLTGTTISLTNQGDLALDGNVTGGALNFDTGSGRLEQISGTLSGGRVAVTAGDVVLDGANTVSEYYLASTGDATLRATGALRIGGQANSMTARAGGAITQLSALFVGSLDASTTSGGISLNLANRIGTIAGLSGSNVFVHNVVDLDIAGDVDGGSQAYFLVDGSRITQSAGTISAGNVTFSAGAGIDQASTAKIIASSFNGTAGTGLSLAGANQIDSATLSTSTGNLLFRNHGDLDAAAFSSPGDLTLISDTGSITQSAALSIGGAASFRAAGDITLANGANSFLSLGPISAGGDLDLRAANLKLDGNVTARNIWFQTAGDLVQQGGIVTADSLGAISNGQISLGNANQIATIGELRARAGDLTLHVTGDVSLTNAVAASGNLVTLTSDTGGITQANNPDAVIYGSRLNARAGGDILLGGANQFGVLSLDLTGSATVNVVGNLMLADTVDVGGDLSLTSGGRITSYGMTGGVTGTLRSHAQSGIAIAFNSGDVGAFGDQITSSGDVGLLAEHVRLTGAVSTSGAFSADAMAGSVSQAAGSVITAASASGSATGDMLLGGGNMIGAIGNLSAAGDLTVRTGGGLAITGPVSAGSSAAMTLIAGGDIDNGGTAAVSGGTLSASAAGHWVQLYGNGLVSFTTLGDASADNFVLYNNGAIDLAGNIVVTSGMVLDATGAITQSDGNLTVRSLSLYGRGGVTADRENHVVRLQGNTYSSAAFRFTNAGDLTVLGNIGSGDVTLNVDGDLTANAGISTLGVITLNANGIQAGELWGNDVIVNGGAHDVRIGRILSQDDVAVTGTGYVSVGSLDLLGGTDAAGDGYNVRISGGDVTLGAASGAITASNYLSYGAGVTPGSVMILATGNATVGVTDANAAIGIAATGDVHAESLDALRIAGASGANVTLIAGTDLTLSGNLVAGRDLTATATAGDVLGASARLGAGLTADGTLTVNGANIALLEASSRYDLKLNGTGIVDVGLAYVGRNYTLKGASFLGAALTPVGGRTGDWHLTSLGDLDLGGATLEYPGSIDFQVAGMLSNGTIQSLTGAVTGSANAVDVYELLGAVGVGVSSTIGAFNLFHGAGGTGGFDIESATAIRVAGSIEANGNVRLAAANGDATAGYITSGGDITVYAQGGDAVLRRSTLTGTTGDLTVESTSGNAVLGEDGAVGIGNDRYFERATGSTGSAHVRGLTGAFVNLDHSATLDQVIANDAAVTVLHGNLAIGELRADTGNASVYLADGALTVNTASGDTVDLEARGGNLTLGSGGISANDIYLNSNRTIDTTAVANLSAGNYLYIDGGTVLAAALDSGGDVELYSSTGGITMGALTGRRDATVSAAGDLSIERIALAGGGQFAAGGTATVRSLTAPGGYALAAMGNVTLGADAGAVASASNIAEAGGSLGGCGCGTGGATVVSLGGNVTINLFSVTGVFDTVAAGSGNVDVRVASGDLGINLLAGHDITAFTPGLLSLTRVESSGGDYTLTAADFGGDALHPVFGTSGATALGNVTIIDTAGDLGAGGWLIAAGDIHVEARGGAITGGMILDAQGDVTAIGQGIRLGQVTGRDVTIDAGTGTADMVGTVSVGRDYTLAGGDFVGNILAVGGARAGSLAVTDTVGDFDHGAADFAFGGAISIRAQHGLLRIGNLQAGNAITLEAGGDLELASAALTGTGANALSLTAGGGLVFGAADAASIAVGNVFTNAGSALTGTGLAASNGAIAINLQQADRLGNIDGGTVQVSVRTGDLAIGNIDAAGAIALQGPTGTLRLGNVTSSAGHIDILGQGDVSTGDLWGRSVVNLGAGGGTGAGNLRFGTVTGGDVALTAAGGIGGAGVSAATLAVVAANGDVDLDVNGVGSQVASLGTVTVANGGFKLRNLQNLGLDGLIEVGGTLDLQVTGALSQNSLYIVANRLQGGATGGAVLGGDNRIGMLGSFDGNGFRLNNISALAIDGIVQGNGGAVTIASHGGMTITANGRILSAAGGDAITLASDGLFTNRRGADALAATAGRWLVYTQTGATPGQSDPNNDFGGLAGTSYYGDAYDFGTGSFAAAPNAGNRFVYGYRPVLTVTPDSFHVTYNGAVPTLTATITGLVNGDSASAAWSGAAALSGAGRNAGTYAVYAALGSLASDMNYAFTFGAGTVVVDPRVISAILTADNRVYDGTANATGSFTLTGLVDGDQVAASGVLAFDSKNAGKRIATASGITLSGADAGNYVVNTTTTALADILVKTITATLSANGRTYDGTTAATGSLALSGLIGNDQVSANGTLAFDNKNAGIGRNVTASGITLSGTDAGNYVVNTTATALADILAKAITATLSANGRTYDGTTAATGSLALNGLIGGDQVAANGTLAFDNKNAGIGRTVTASGITLSGADAGNYVVNATTTALADILAKTITATLAANGRVYDGTTAATGTLGLNGVVAGDAVSAGSTGMAFDSRNAGVGRTVTASGITLSGADAGNYVVNTTATALADILAKAITATLAANGRVYDGTAAATGTLGLNGVVLGDQVGVTAGGIAFDSRNAGNRTATATGLALNGADAANYTISGTATGTATIAQRAITATATADSRAYDGTTGTTGRIALTGVISGDAVTGTATYRFADANAGSGRAVQVNGLALSGVDAGNYTVSLTGGPVIADITRRTVTVSANNATKLFGQPDPVFGYTISTGSLVNGDGFTGALARMAGEQVGSYAIGQGTLALSANYLLTVIPGTLVISFTKSGADASDALRMLRTGVDGGFSLNQDPSRNLEGDGKSEGANGGGK
nr:YDG domain-containing protein [uncultured Sphingomonas sp.]